MVQRVQRKCYLTPLSSTKLIVLLSEKECFCKRRKKIQEILLCCTKVAATKSRSINLEDVSRTRSEALKFQ